MGDQRAAAIIRLPEVLARVGLSRSSVLARVEDGTFPAPVSLGARAVGWRASEIDSWLAGLSAEKRPAAVARGKALGASNRTQPATTDKYEDRIVYALKRHLFLYDALVSAVEEIHGVASMFNPMGVRIVEIADAILAQVREA